MQDGFNATATEIGILLSCAAASGLLSSLLAPNLKKYLKIGPTLMGCIALWSIALFSLSVSTSATTLTMGWMLATSVGGIYEIVQNTYRFEQVPEQYLGRVLSVFRLIAFSTQPLTLLLGGLSISFFGPVQTLYILAAGMVLLALFAGLSPLNEVLHTLD